MKIPKGWKATQLSEVANIVRGSSPRPAGDPRFFGGDHLPWITVGEITRSSGMHLTETRTFLTREGANYTRIIDPDTLLLTNSGATLGVPKITKLRAGANDGIAALLEPKADKRFLYYFLQSKTRYLRESVAPGVGQPNLNTELIGLVPMALPPKSEQLKIANILSTWDTAIEKLDLIIDAKNRRKKSIIQQLLSGKKRLNGSFGKWKTVTLGDVLAPISRTVQKPSTPFLAAGIRSHGKGVFLKPAFKPEDIALEELSELRAGDLVVNITFAWEGAAAIVSDEADGALVSHRFPSFEFKAGKASRSFFRHYILSKRFVFDCGLASPGGAGRNRVLSKSAFLNIELKLPLIEEQERIGKILDAAADEITLLRKQRDALDQQKRGLMQRLLTGKIRVKINKP